MNKTPRKYKYRRIRCICKICERLRLVSPSWEMFPNEKIEFAKNYVCSECEEKVEE